MEKFENLEVPKCSKSEMTSKNMKKNIGNSIGFIFIGFTFLLLYFSLFWFLYPQTLYAIYGILYDWIISQLLIWTSPLEQSSFNPFQGMGTLFLQMPPLVKSWLFRF